MRLNHENLKEVNASKICFIGQSLVAFILLFLEQLIAAEPRKDIVVVVCENWTEFCCRAFL